MCRQGSALTGKGFYRTLVRVTMGVRQLLLTYAVTGVTALQTG